MLGLEARYYVKVTVTDRPAVLAAIARILGEHEVSVATANRRDGSAEEGTAALVIMTHRARENATRAALPQIRALTGVSRMNAFLRVEA